jgi:hypothetical protein
MEHRAWRKNIANFKLHNAKGKLEEPGGRDSLAQKNSAGTITKPSSLMNLQKAGKPMVSIAGARCFAPGRGHAQRAPTLQGAHKNHWRSTS